MKPFISYRLVGIVADSSGRGYIRYQCRSLAIILWTEALSSKVDEVSLWVESVAYTFLGHFEAETKTRASNTKVRNLALPS